MGSHNIAGHLRAIGRVCGRGRDIQGRERKEVSGDAGYTLTAALPPCRRHLVQASVLRLRHVGRRGTGRGARRARRTGGGRLDEAEERLLTRLGMSEYYGSEGFNRPPSDVYSYGGGYSGDDGAGE